MEGSLTQGLEGLLEGSMEGSLVDICRMCLWGALGVVMVDIGGKPSVKKWDIIKLMFLYFIYTDKICFVFTEPFFVIDTVLSMLL